MDIERAIRQDPQNKDLINLRVKHNLRIGKKHNPIRKKWQCAACLSEYWNNSKKHQINDTYWGNIYRYNRDKKDFYTVKGELVQLYFHQSTPSAPFEGLIDKETGKLAVFCEWCIGSCSYCTTEDAITGEDETTPLIFNHEYNSHGDPYDPGYVFFGPDDHYHHNPMCVGCYESGYSCCDVWLAPDEEDDPEYHRKGDNCRYGQANLNEAVRRTVDWIALSDKLSGGE